MCGGTGTLGRWQQNDATSRPAVEPPFRVAGWAGGYIYSCPPVTLTDQRISLS